MVVHNSSPVKACLTTSCRQIFRVAFPVRFIFTTSLNIMVYLLCCTQITLQKNGCHGSADFLMKVKDFSKKKVSRFLARTCWTFPKNLLKKILRPLFSSIKEWHHLA